MEEKQRSGESTFEPPYFLRVQAVLTGGLMTASVTRVSSRRNKESTADACGVIINANTNVVSPGLEITVSD